MLSGRWVRGRRKVMKKPVMAIDMRRTATVLDFAVLMVSRPLRILWLRRTYLSSPSCDLEWTMRRLRSRLRTIVCSAGVRLPEVVRRISVLGGCTASIRSYGLMRPVLDYMFMVHMDDIVSLILATSPTCPGSPRNLSNAGRFSMAGLTF